MADVESSSASCGRVSKKSSFREWPRWLLPCEVKFAGGEEIKQVVHQPGFAGAEGWRTVSSATQIESRSVGQAHVTNETIGDCPGHRAAFVAGNLVVAMMIAWRVMSAFAFKQTKIKRILPQQPVDVVVGK